MSPLQNVVALLVSDLSYAVGELRGIGFPSEYLENRLVYYRSILEGKEALPKVPETKEAA